MALFKQSKRLASIFDFLGVLTLFYGIACLITLHVWRFSSAARLASLDFYTLQERRDLLKDYLDNWEKDGEMPDSGQYFRGTYLWGLVIYLWVGGCVLFCV